MSRVTETLIASRKSVVSSRRLGKEQNSSALLRYIVATTIASAAEMFIVMNRSSSIGGSGTTIITTTRTTAPAASRSVCLVSFWSEAAFMRAPSGGPCGRRRRGARRPPGRAPRGSAGRPRPTACSERASGGSAMTGTPLSAAISRIFWAIRSEPLATTSGAAFSASYLQRDGEVGRVRDDDVRGRDVGHHAGARGLHLAAADRAAHLGRELRGLVLLLDLLLVHLHRLLVAVALVDVVDDRR